MKYLKLFRVKHYVKNFIIFLPIVFSGNMLNIAYFATVLLGFLSFNLMASYVYIVNDIKDVEQDRNHPTKCRRPIASGAISIARARILGFMSLFVSLLLLAFLVNRGSNMFIAIYLVAYLLNNVIYTHKLKHIPILDVFSIAIGFVIRVFFGATIINVEVSDLLYLTIIAAAFYMGYGKRRNEIGITNKAETRAVLKNYNLQFLDKSMVICATLTIIFYSMWALIMDMESYSSLVMTVPIILIIMMRYSLIVEGDSDGDPTEVILGDRLLMGLAVIYASLLLIILYW